MVRGQRSRALKDYTGKTEDAFYKDIDTTMEESLKQEPDPGSNRKRYETLSFQKRALNHS